MKIDGSSAHSINFIEQKKSNTSTPEQNTTQNRVDTFESNSITSVSLLESNESIAMLQIAHSSISKLQNGGEELQKLNEKFSFFSSQESELNEKFEEISLSMQDIVDNTMFNDSGLFYAEHTLSIGSFEFRFSMINETSIEDFVLGNNMEVNSFIDGLGSIKENINSIKTQIEVINFNHMAVLDSKNPLINIEANMLSKEPIKLTPNIEELKQAHDTSLLKDKVSHLLD
ncbi:MAG TPA: hypothetical protein EYG93_09490 [Sulfurospirillum arcachonense]|nr:hypothetical protein [Sulfurospirillum arcachonense]HIP45543.1 hypothetical protein [Sulfurospirillum arcachonense]